MSRDQTVLWNEGMFLTPHHFQLWEACQQYALQFRVGSLASFGWGLTELEINRESLANGDFSIIKCGGVFPGGTTFSATDTRGPAPGRALRNALDPAVQTIDVYLALPSRSPSPRDLSGNDRADSRSGRYVTESVHVFDENTGENEREITVRRKNLKILVGGESLADYDHLQVARLKQESGGSFALDDTYIPPCLHISCSGLLTRIVRRLLEALHSKSASLSESRSQRTSGLLEYSSSDLGNLWLLHTVNSFIPLIDHYHRVPQSHPEHLFVSLAQLAGALMTFSPSALPKDLPCYDHNNLSRTFLGLEKAIQELLKAVVPSGAVEIRLERESESKFTAQVADDQLLVSAQVFIAARADMPEHQLIEELPRQAKISSVDKISPLLGLALPGVALVYCSVPPHPLHVKLGLQYFRLESRGDPESQRHWEEICKSRTLAIRVPGQRFPGLRLELWSIKE
jgi:type VI secretion system protein ImpJ